MSGSSQHLTNRGAEDLSTRTIGERGEEEQITSSGMLNGCEQEAPSSEYVNVSILGLGVIPPIYELTSGKESEERYVK